MAELLQDRLLDDRRQPELEVVRLLVGGDPVESERVDEVAFGQPVAAQRRLGLLAPSIGQDDVAAPAPGRQAEPGHAVDDRRDVGARLADPARQRGAVGRLALHLEVVDELQVLGDLRRDAFVMPVLVTFHSGRLYRRPAPAGRAGQVTRTSLPAWPCSMTARCAAAASASGKLLSIAGASAPLWK